MLVSIYRYNLAEVAPQWAWLDASVTSTANRQTVDARNASPYPFVCINIGVVADPGAGQYPIEIGCALVDAENTQSRPLRGEERTLTTAAQARHVGWGCEVLVPPKFFIRAGVWWNAVANANTLKLHAYGYYLPKPIPGTFLLP